MKRTSLGAWLACATLVLAILACSETVAVEPLDQLLSVHGTVLEGGEPVPDVVVGVQYRVFLGYEWREKWETHVLRETLTGADGSYQLELDVTATVCQHDLYVVSRRGSLNGGAPVACGTNEAVIIELEDCIPIPIIDGIRTCLTPQA